MANGNSHFERTGKLCPKINVYVKHHVGGTTYLHSTNWHMRCKDAVQAASKERGIPAADLFARFDKR